MNPLLLTVTFLMLLGILTSSQMKQFVENSLETHLYNSYACTTVEARNLKEVAVAHEIRTHKADPPATQAEEPTPEIPGNDDIADVDEKKIPEKKQRSTRSVALEFNLATPPNNSRLNLYLLKEGEKYNPYEFLAALIRRLYGKLQLFYEIPQAECKILDWLMQNNAKTEGFHFADELAKIEFEDERLQKLFHLMLKGGDNCPSLLNYITFDNVAYYEKKRINLLFAPKEILEAIFKQDEVVNRVVDYRTRLLQQLVEQEAHRKELSKDQCLTRQNIRDELKSFFESLGQDSYSTAFDLSLGKPGNILYVNDPKTGLVLREKLFLK